MRFLLFAILCIGCGGTIANGGDASTTSDAGSKDVSAGDSTSIPDAGFTSSLTFESSNGSGQFLGIFYANAQQATSGCQHTQNGACSVATCSGAPLMPPIPSAGTLTLSVGSLSTSVTQNLQTGYYLTNIGFAGGDVLGVSASGGDVPAFGTQTITSPGAINVVPAVPSTITLSQDLTFSWTGGEPGASVIVGLVRQGMNAYTSMSCTFDAVAGTGTIQQAQLTSLQGPGPTTGEVSIGQARSTTFASGTFVIELGALQYEQHPVTYQ